MRAARSSTTTPAGVGETDGAPRGRLSSGVPTIASSAAIWPESADCE